jgi:hypothetical protein
VTAATVDEDDPIDVAAAQIALQRGWPLAGGEQHGHVTGLERGGRSGEDAGVEGIGEKAGVGLADNRGD